MKINHHITDDVLLAYSAGDLDEAASLVVATHLALCPTCRTAVRQMEAIGGALMEDLAPVPVANDAFDTVMAELSAHTCGDGDVCEHDLPLPDAALPHLAQGTPGTQGTSGAQNTSGAQGNPLAQIKSGVQDDDLAAPDTTYPEPLRSYLKGAAASKWRKIGIGVEYLCLDVGQPGAVANGGKTAKRQNTCRAGLLRIAPGTTMPRHGHKGSEMTLVLAGGYSDDFGRFERGDVEQADKETEHRPVADPDEPCICLVATNAPLALPGMPNWMGSLVNRFLPF